MTQAGVAVKTSMGPGRQIYDKNYYLKELRGRHSELREQLEKFNVELVGAEF